MRSRAHLLSSDSAQPFERHWPRCITRHAPYRPESFASQFSGPLRSVAARTPATVALEQWSKAQTSVHAFTSSLAMPVPSVTSASARASNVVRARLAFVTGQRHRAPSRCSPHAQHRSASVTCKTRRTVSSSRREPCGVDAVLRTSSQRRAGRAWELSTAA